MLFLSSKKKNKDGAKQAGGQATKPKGTQVKFLSASASRPSDKDTQKSASVSRPSDKRHAEASSIKCVLLFELEEEEQGWR